MDSKYWLLNTDSSSLIRAHSPTLSGRSHVYVPNNRVKGNRPVDIGYSISTVGLSVRRPLYGLIEPAWNLPLSIRRVPVDAVGNTFAAQQVNDLLNNKDLPFHKELTVNALDRQYCTPEYIVDTWNQAYLVNIIRFKNNRSTWQMLTSKEQAERRESNKDNRGATAIYGEKYRLKEVDEWDKSPDHKMEFGVTLGNGRKVIVIVEIWEDRMIRSKRGKNMKDKPFRLVSIRLLDPESQEAVFKRRLWLGVWGKKNQALNAEEIYWAYRLRFDIEHFFRFGKQRLLLEKFQTPDEEHLDNWLEVVNLAYWLLWVAKKESAYYAHKWQQYDKRHKERVAFELPPTPSEVQRQLERIILSFDQDPFRPKVQIKGKGRQKGELQSKRKRYKVVRKAKKR